MSIRKIAVFVLTLALLLALASCGNSQEPASGSSGPSDIKIGILIPGSPTDGGHCQLAADAGETLKEEYGYTVSVVEATEANTIKNEAEAMAQSGYDIILGHGGQFVTPFSEIAPDYPDSWFLTSGGDLVSENQFPLCICLEESSYIAGVIAGSMTQTDVIAYTVGGDFPNYMKTANGFELGAKSVNPDVEVLGNVLASTVAAEAYEATMNQINNGADFIFSNSNEGQSGALKAVAESDNVYGFGILGDFTSSAPDKIIGNVMGDWQTGFINTVNGLINGEITESEIYFMTMSDGSVYFQWNDDLKGTLPEEVIAAAEEAEAGILDGTIDVPNEFELDG